MPEPLGYSVKLDQLINSVLRPFGLILWRTIDVDEDENGVPFGPIKHAGWHIGRRPRKGERVWR